MHKEEADCATLSQLEFTFYQNRNITREAGTKKFIKADENCLLLFSAQKLRATSPFELRAYFSSPPQCNNLNLHFARYVKCLTTERHVVLKHVVEKRKTSICREGLAARSATLRTAAIKSSSFAETFERHSCGWLILHVVDFNLIVPQVVTISSLSTFLENPTPIFYSDDPTRILFGKLLAKRI